MPSLSIFGTTLCVISVLGFTPWWLALLGAILVFINFALELSYYRDINIIAVSVNYLSMYLSYSEDE